MKAIHFVLFMAAMFITMEKSSAVIPDQVPCVQELELNFFIEPIVNQGLSLYDIPQGLWSPINLDLHSRNQTVPDRMKQRTAYMYPNPIEYPLQRIPTAKILLAVFHEIFLETMRNYQVNEQPSADLIFDYIVGQQEGRLINCFGPEVKELIPRLQ
ncbi:MAG: hypothetical protein H0W88_07220 [Parachlamydiaceae bacterium]|nr:hypothetical protein [Parachlamydiaceae bacterium]